MGRAPTLLVLLLALLAAAAGDANEVLRVKFNLAKLDGAPEEDSIIFNIKKRLAPRGFGRFKMLCETNFFDGAPFFRVVPRFVVQFGISADSEQTKLWRERGPILDDPLIIKNSRGTVTFATSGKDTRSTQLFINLRDNAHLDADFTPIGEIEGDGMDVVSRIWNGYGEEPSQGRLNNEGIKFADAEFPRLSIIRSTEILEDKEESGEFHTSEEFEKTIERIKEGDGLEKEIERLQAEVANLREEVDHARHETGDNRKAMLKAEQAQGRAERDRDEALDNLSAAKAQLANLLVEVDSLTGASGLAEDDHHSMAESLADAQKGKGQLEVDYKISKEYFINQIQKLEHTIRTLKEKVASRDVYIARVLQLLAITVLLGMLFTVYRSYCGAGGSGDKDCDV